MPMTLPLEGLTVLDFSTLLPGPLATFMLAEAGAEVIKVERPGGEDMRGFPPRLGEGSATFAMLNAGKKSIAVDLKSEEGRSALRQRDLTGEGCHLDIAMADAMFTFAWFGLAEGFAAGRFPGSQENMLAGGSPRYALYVTADDRFLAVGALEPKFWAAFCHGIALPEPLRDDAADPAATRAAIAAAVRRRTAAEWTAILEPLDCCATILSPLEDAVADPQFRERRLLDATAVDPAGNRIPAASVPIAPTLRRSLDEPR